jgi:PEP-CTERM motif
MRVRQVVGLLILLSGFQSTKTYGQVVATWTDSSGNWSNAANWSTNPTVPNNSGGTTYNVLINGTGSDTITYDASGTVLSSLTLGAGETLRGSGAAPILTISPSPGSIALGGAGTINGVKVMLSSGGEVELSSFVNSSLTAVGSVGMDRSVSFNNSVLSVQGDLGTGGGDLALQNGTSATVSGTLSLSTGQITVSNSSLTVMGDYKGGNIHSALALNSGVLNVQGNFTDAVSNLNLSGGSSATIGGKLTNAESNVMVDGSNLVVKGTYAIDHGQTTVQNGGSLRVAGDFQQGEFSALGLTGGSKITVGGNFNMAVGAGVTISGSAMTVNGDFTNSPVNSYNKVTLQNGGVLDVGGTFTNGTAANNQPNSLQLAGQGNVANLYAVQNSGLVQVDTGSILNVGAGGFSNNTGGTLTLGGTTNVSGAFTNSGGSVILSPTASLTANSYSQSAGLTDLSGTLKTNSYSQTGGATTIETGGTVTATTFTATGGTVTVNGILDPTAVEFGSSAVLQGTGTIIGNVSMGGTLTPGAPGTPGTLTIDGNYEQLSTGMLQELMGPGSQSFLNVTGDVALDSGSFLDIILLNGYNPLGQTFSIMDYGSLVGQFSNGSTFSEDGYVWDVTYGRHGMEVTAVGTPEPSSFLLLGLGSLVLGAFAKRKKVAQ